MHTLNDLIDGDAQWLDTGFTFTEGPLYHPDGFYYFVDVRESHRRRSRPLSDLRRAQSLDRRRGAQERYRLGRPCRRTAGGPERHEAGELTVAAQWLGPS